MNMLIDTKGFIPHGHCYLWQPGLVWLHIVSDAAIALAYYSIPVLLVYFVSKRRDIPFNWVFLLFGLFIIACGTGHLMDIWTLWHPTYWLSGLLKALTAIASVYTALELIPLLPKLLALPSPAQLEAANQELEQTLRQLQQAQTQLIQTEKMSSLGQLVAGIAHEINNPVSFIQGNLIYANEYIQNLLHLVNLYEQSYPEPHASILAASEARDLNFIKQDLPKILASIKSGAERICQVVLSLRSFSRLDEAEMKRVNIHDGIDSTLMLLQHRIKPTTGHLNISVQKEYGEIPLVECYAGQLNQVFMNILSNAIDALEEKSKSNSEEKQAIAVGSEHTQYLKQHHISAELKHEKNAPEIRINTELNSEQVLIQITDNGSGVSERIQNRLFDPFFTTKPVGEGTGLGLSISHQIIVEKHRGQLECISELGQGTTFLIKIPVRQLREHSNPK